MLSNVAEFWALLERYEDDPALCSKALRTHSMADPATFLSWARNVLLERPVNRSLRFVAALSITAGMIQVLIDLFPRDRIQVLSLAKKLCQCDPRFDLALAEYLNPPAGASAGEEAALHAVLDILDAISDGDRLVPTVLKMLKHSNPKIRSKAALFVGSRTQNVAWAESRTQEFDGRVRANILESLFGLNTDNVQQIFLKHVRDDNNRAAGNAVLGLYQVGNAQAVEFIYEMARHPEPRFRNTCAWLIGRTSDPRFYPVLTELLKDSDELVRSQAFKALGLLKRASRAPLPTLQSAIVQQQVTNSESFLTATVLDEAGQPVRGITPTSFIARSSQPNLSARRFTVQEYDCRTSLNVALLLCLPATDESAAEAAAVAAVRACERLRRTKDRWAILKVSGKHTTRTKTSSDANPVARYRQVWSVLGVNPETDSKALAFEPKFEYSMQDFRIAQMLEDRPIILDENLDDPGTKATFDTLLRVDVASGHPHLICVGAGPVTTVLDSLAALRSKMSAMIHVLAGAPEWQTEYARRLTLETGGSYQTFTDDAELRAACFSTYSSLLHHYRVTWTDPIRPDVLDVQCPVGRGSASYAALGKTCELDPVAECA